MMQQHDRAGSYRSSSSSSSNNAQSSSGCLNPVLALSLIIFLWVVLLSLYHTDLKRDPFLTADISHLFRPFHPFSQTQRTLKTASSSSHCINSGSSSTQNAIVPIAALTSPSSIDELSSPLDAFADTPYLKPTPEALALLPSRCGNWMKRYAALHAHIASGAWFIEQINATGTLSIAPPMMIYWVNVKERLGGISDRWPVLSTAMVLAVLTDRAIFIDWEGYEAAYYHPNLPYLHNTTWRHIYGQYQWYREHASEVYTAIQYNREQQQHNSTFVPIPLPSPPPIDIETKIDKSEYFITGFHETEGIVSPKGSTRLHEFKGGIPVLRGVFPSHKAVIIAEQTFWAKGLIRRFYENEEVTRALHELGLREALCHGCMINFVLHINEEVMSMFAPYALQLRQLHQLTVGVQIRMGDSHMTGGAGMTERQRADTAWQRDNEKLLRHGMTFMGCGEQLIDIHRISDDQPTLFFLVSDHVGLRGMLQERYGQRLLVIPTSDRFSIGHTDIGDPSLYNTTISTLKRDRAADYLRVAAGEQWILAYNDFLVIEHEGSGFGRSAAFRSLQVGNTWKGRGGPRCDGDKGALTVVDWDLFGHRY